MTGNHKSCIVVGAGISGLLAAEALKAEGWDVTVLDKGRGVGGRMATRRVGGGTFDHGAQFFTVRDARFSGLVEGWLGTGAAAEWSRGFADAEGRPNEDGHPRYRGARGMTSIPKHVASGLDVRTGERAVRVDDATMLGGYVRVRVAGRGSRAGARQARPQDLDLAIGELQASDGARTTRSRLYDPCLALRSCSTVRPTYRAGRNADQRTAAGLDRRQRTQGISEVPP